MALGPYQHETDTYADPMPSAVAALHAAGRVHSGDPDHLVRDTVMGYLTEACAKAGVELGEYDRQKLAWLTEVDSGTAQVLIGVITRAYAAGRDTGHEKG